MEYVTPQLTGEDVTKRPQTRERLSAISLPRLAKIPGLYSDGGGLALKVRSPTSHSWVYRWSLNKVAHESGLGHWPDVSLARARELAAALRSVKAEGRNPIAERARQAAMTFGACAARYIEMKSTGWTAKQTSLWQNTLKDHASMLDGLSVAAISVQDVLAVLLPIWKTKAETASRLRQRIMAILDWAKAHGYRVGDNPAGKSILQLLPDQSTIVRHMPALGLDQLPDFMRKLRSIDSVRARALEWTILTAARADQTISAPWSEIVGNLWTVPADRMLKGEREHVVPLSDAALACLPARGEGRVFPIGPDDMLRLLRRMGYSKEQASVHGMRSVFRDWASIALATSRSLHSVIPPLATPSNRRISEQTCSNVAPR